MWVAPVRIARETLRVEASNLHSMERLGYKMAFAYEGEDERVLEDIQQYLEDKTKKYEGETYKLRLKAYEKGAKGIHAK